MPPNKPSISPGETEVLKAVWKIEKGSIGEIVLAVDPELEMDYSTVQTYVRRLETKGYLSATRIGRNKIYRTTVAKEQVMGEAVDDFVQLHFDGKFLPMIRHLVDSREVSDEELKDLMRLVKELKAEKGSRDAR